MAILPFTIQLSYAGTPAGTITYNAGTDTITVIGANSTHPAEFLDLYNADVAGGWGQVFKQGANQYLFDCKIVFGNSSTATYFTDIGKQVILNYTGTAGEAVINVTAQSVMTLGYASSVANKYTDSGCDLFFTGTSSVIEYGILAMVNSTFYAYSTTFEAPNSPSTSYTIALLGSNRVWNCRFQCQIGGRIWLYGYNLDCFKIDNENVRYGVESPSGNISGINVLVTQYYLFYYFGLSSTVIDLYGRGASDGGLRASSGMTANQYLINADLDDWTINWASASATGEIYRQYTFDLFVLNGALTDFVEDANVTLTHDSTVYGSWLTNSTGQISTQTLTYGFYNQTGGDTMYGGTPWTLTITHSDWETYTSVFYPYSEIDWSISMQDTSASNNNMLLAGLLMGGVAFLGIIVIRRKTT